jgi:hypothetical protein
MRNLLFTLPLLLLSACGEDDKDVKTADCPGDTSTQDTAVDTGTEPVDTADTSGGDTADTSLPVDTGADTGGDTSVPVDTGTDTGATDTGTSDDTGGDTSAG